MTVRTLPVPLEQGRAVCSAPEHLPLVDAATAKPGGPEAQVMKATLCRRCPVVEQCFTWGMTHAEAGIWGGISPAVRGKRGAPKHLPIVPDYLHRGRAEGTPAQPSRRRRRQEPGDRKPEVTTLRLAELGVTSAQVKRWAHEQGRIRTIMGRVSLTTIEAYAAAHQAS